MTTIDYATLEESRIIQEIEDTIQEDLKSITINMAQNIGIGT